MRLPGLPDPGPSSRPRGWGQSCGCQGWHRGWPLHLRERETSVRGGHRRCAGMSAVDAEIVLYVPVKRIDLHNRVAKDSTALLEPYFVFPFQVHKPRFGLQGTHSVVEPLTDQFPGSNSNYYAVQHWANVLDPRSGSSPTCRRRTSWRSMEFIAASWRRTPSDRRNAPRVAALLGTDCRRRTDRLARDETPQHHADRALQVAIRAGAPAGHEYVGQLPRNETAARDAVAFSLAVMTARDSGCATSGCRRDASPGGPGATTASAAGWTAINRTSCWRVGTPTRQEALRGGGP